jgi:hypothetical protein
MWKMKMHRLPLSEAMKIEPDFEVGEELSEEIKLLDFRPSGDPGHPSEPDLQDPGI